MLTFLLLGASGDVAKVFVYPALFLLYKYKHLPNECRIIGYARTKMNREDFEKHITNSIQSLAENETQIKDFLKICYYEHGLYEELDKLANVLNSVETNHEDRIFYLGVPPELFLETAKRIHHSLRTTKGWNRIIIEKPFGRGTRTFRCLSENLKKMFSQEEIYRIDHYIGTEVVQNMLVLRFANTVFEPIWGREHVENVQIIFQESRGTEGRGGHFDSNGVVRDVMQNHCLQILAYFAMEPPVTLSPEDVSNEKTKLLRSIEPVREEDTVYGQYVASEFGPSYRDDKTVADDSKTATFCTCALKIKNRRWDGVPFIIKAGFALNEDLVEIRMTLKKPPGTLYKDIEENQLVIRILPDENIFFQIMNKVPDLNFKLALSKLEQRYDQQFQDKRIPQPYERLILQCMQGNMTHFVREQEIDAAWKVFDKILDNESIPVVEYPRGSEGPQEAFDLAAKYGVKLHRKSEIVP